MVRYLFDLLAKAGALVECPRERDDHVFWVKLLSLV